MAHPEEWAIKDKKTREYFIELAKSKNIYIDYYLSSFQRRLNLNLRLNCFM